MQVSPTTKQFLAKVISEYEEEIAEIEIEFNHPARYLSNIKAKIDYMKSQLAEARRIYSTYD